MKPSTVSKIGLGVAFVVFSILLSTGSAHASGTSAGTNIENKATTYFEDENTNSYHQDSNTVSVRVSEVYSVSANCTVVGQSVPTHTSATYSCWVRNTGNAPNTFTLTASSTPATWTPALYADDGALPNNGAREGDETHTPPANLSIPADTTYNFFLVVDVPADTTNGQVATSKITIVGGGDAGTGDDIKIEPITTTAKAPALTVDKKVRNVTGGATPPFATLNVTAKPNDILEYQVMVKNTGLVTATKVRLEDTTDTAYVEYSANGLYVTDADTPTGGRALHENTNDDLTACSSDACGAANHTGTKVTFFLGNGANEAAGGTLNVNSAVYVYYRVKVK